MVQKKRRTSARKPIRTTKKVRARTKKGVSRAVQAMRVTPAQKKKLQYALRELEKHINNMTRKYNQILNTISKF